VRADVACTCAVSIEHCASSEKNSEDDQPRGCSLFLGDLSIFCAEKDIEDAFNQFGKIVEVRIQRSKETSRALSYGFIEFAEQACAETALHSMNNYMLKGRPLRYVEVQRDEIIRYSERAMCTGSAGQHTATIRSSPPFLRRKLLPQCTCDSWRCRRTARYPKRFSAACSATTAPCSTAQSRSFEWTR
jgi:RNA recognition motif-containing protein